MLEKKKEVEAKLNSRETVADHSADSSSASTTTTTGPAPQAAAADTNIKCEPLANKFQNNGSFLELFREMQKKSAECEVVHEK